MLIRRRMFLRQQGGESVTVTLHPYARTDLSNFTVTGQEKWLGKDITTTDYMGLTPPLNANPSYAIYSIDTSSIPSDAVIDSVTCKAKVYINTTSTARVTTRKFSVYKGSTLIGGVNVSSSTTALNVPCGTDWSRADLNSFRMRFDGQRASASGTGYSMRGYGADITITYHLP